MKPVLLLYSLIITLTNACIGLAQLPVTASAVNVPTSKPRLGEVHYGNRAGGLIGQEGPTQQLLFLAEGDQLLRLQVGLTAAGNVVKALRFVVQQRSGAQAMYLFGEAIGAVWQPVVAVKKGRSLVGISGAGGWFIDNLRFHFDDGSTTPRYGGTGGDNDFQLLLTKSPKGHYRGRLMGLWGSATDQLESVGLVFFPIE
jgi:hypothetical protein